MGALHADGVTIRAKAWTSTNRGRFPKQAFRIDLVERQVTCPARQVVAVLPGVTTLHFPAATCQACALRAACTTATRGGRSLALHPQEALLQHLRATQHQPAGRAQLRERTTVEHSLARIDQIQGATARYKGARKNILDLRRTAVVTNLQRLAGRCVTLRVRLSSRRLSLFRVDAPDVESQSGGACGR